LSSIFTGAATYEIVGVVSNTALIGTPELQRNDGTPDTSGNKLSITPVSNMVGTSEITIKAKTTGTDFAFLTHTFTFTIPNPLPRKKVTATIPDVNAGDIINLAEYIEGVSEVEQPGGTADVLSIDAIFTNLTNGNVLKDLTHATKVVFDTISATSSIDDTFTVTVSDGSGSVSVNLQFSVHLLVAAANDYSPVWWQIRDKHTVAATNPKYSQLGNYSSGGINNKIEFDITGDGVFDESTHKVALGDTKLAIGKSFIVKVKHMGGVGKGGVPARRHLMTWGLTTRTDVPDGRVFPWTTTSGGPLYNGTNDMFIQNWWTPGGAEGDAQNPYYANVIGSSTTGIAAPPGMKDGEASLSYPEFVNYTSKNKNAAANSSATSPVSSIKNFHVPGTTTLTNATYESNDWIKFTRVSDTVFKWYLWKPSDAAPSWVPQHTWNPTSGDNFRLMWSTFDLFGAVYYIGET